MGSSSFGVLPEEGWTETGDRWTRPGSSPSPVRCPPDPPARSGGAGRTTGAPRLPGMKEPAGQSRFRSMKDTLPIHEQIVGKASTQGSTEDAPALQQPIHHDEIVPPASNEIRRVPAGMNVHRFLDQRTRLPRRIGSHHHASGQPSPRNRTRPPAVPSTGTRGNGFPGCQHSGVTLRVGASRIDKFLHLCWSHRLQSGYPRGPSRSGCNHWAALR